MSMDSRGWQVGRSLLDCHKYMLENQVACDVTFLFTTADGSTIPVPAHSYMLRCRSPVFEAMLSGNFKEKEEDITITDIEPDVFKEVLRYMYYEEASLSGHNVLHVLFAAKKYLLDGLVSLCKDFLKAEICEDNVCTIFTNCLRYDEKQLTDQCVDFITSHANLIVKSEDFLNLSQEALQLLLSNDNFGLPTELDLCKACKKWANVQKKAGSTRNILGDAFYHIRFHAFSPEDILDISEEESEFLTDKEIVWFLRNKIKKGDSKALMGDMCKFNMNERKRVSLFTIPNRFKFARRGKGSWQCEHEGPDRICFKCLQNVYFRGITLYGGCKKGDRHTVDLKLLKDSEVLCTSRSTITSDGTSTPIEVLVNDPVCLEANVLYTIEADRPGPIAFCGNAGKDTVEMADITVVYYTYDGRNNDTDTEMGQIPQIILSK